MSLPSLRKLWSRLGSEEKLIEILNDFYQRMAQDVLIGFFFQGKDLSVIIDHQCKLLLFVMGVQPSYAGRAPQTAHLHLPPILPGHFDRRIVLLEETLHDHALSTEDIEIWSRFESSFRESIVKKSQRSY